MAAPSFQITVLSSGDRVEEEILRRAATGGGAAFGLGLYTLRQFERALLAAAGFAPLDALASELLMAESAALATKGSILAPLAEDERFARSILRLYDALREGGSSAGELARVAARMPGAAGRRASALAEVFIAYERSLVRRSLLDEVGARIALLDRLLDGALPEEIARAGEILVEDAIFLSCLRVRLFQRLALRGKRVVVRLPDVEGRPALGATLTKLEALLSAEAPSVAIAFKRYGHGPLAPFHERLFREGDPVRIEGDPVHVIAGGDVQAELRAVVRTIRRHLASGVSAEEICVAARGMAEIRGPIARALDDARIPWRDWRGTSTLETSPCRIALHLLDLAERNFPRGALAELLTSSAIAPGRGGFSGGSITRLLRDAASRDNRPPGHGARLVEYARRLGAAACDERTARAAKTARRGADRFSGLFSHLDLPAKATVGEHARRLLAALSHLGIGEECDPSLLDETLLRVAARDRAALRSIEEVCGELIRAAERCGISNRSIGRTVFRDRLAARLTLATSSSREVRGGAVVLAEVGDLIGRSFSHLILVDVVDGRMPRRGAQESLLDDHDRRQFNQSAGRAVFQNPMDDEPLLFALACAAARERLTLTCALVDPEGRRSTRSPFVSEVLATIGATDLDAEPAAIVPRFVACVTERELLCRAAQHHRTSGEIAPGGSLQPRLAAVAARSARVGDGRLRRSTALDALGRRLTGSLGGAPIAWTSSASAIEQYASCPFRFFAARMLRLPEQDPDGDDLDSREQGTLWHAVVRAAFEELAARDLLPVRSGDRSDDERAAAIAGCDRALAAWREAQRTGPEEVWRLRCEQARAMTIRLVEAEGRYGFGTPIGFEVPFDEGAALLLPSPDGTEAIAVRGRIDRLDERSGELDDARLDEAMRGVLVIDYKSGRVSDRLNPSELARTQFQLPIYAAWARRAYPGRHIDAGYVSLRTGERSKTLRSACGDEGSIDRLLELDPERRAALRGAIEVPLAAGAADLQPDPARNLADSAWALFSGVRAGRFDVRPYDGGETCDRCGYSSVCRVETAGSGE